ncbi:hypothetical protein BC670_0634 [Flavobacterium branchiophilum]|uniref:Uncharacterized protein n=1 Tax=Flavobacterium branchiophilum TaxID=55197 RepID=A0A543G138_9FLAO|nr:hypothetical protein BC670_0634 [Flavobacterium branchiophilum]
MKELLITCIIFYFSIGDKKMTKARQSVIFIMTYIGVMIGTLIYQKYLK